MTDEELFDLSMKATECEVARVVLHDYLIESGWWNELLSSPPEHTVRGVAALTWPAFTQEKALADLRGGWAYVPMAIASVLVAGRWPSAFWPLAERCDIFKVAADEMRAAIRASAAGGSAVEEEYTLNGLYRFGGPYVDGVLSPSTDVQAVLRDFCAWVFGLWAQGVEFARYSSPRIAMNADMGLERPHYIWLIHIDVPPSARTPMSIHRTVGVR